MTDNQIKSNSDVERLVSSLIDLCRDAMSADPSLVDSDWERIALPLEVSAEFGSSGGIAYLLSASAEPAFVYFDAFKAVELAAELCTVLTRLTATLVERARIEISPSWTYSLKWLGPRPDSPLLVIHDGLWPDEPGYHGPVSAAAAPHRTLDHAYVASDPSAVSAADSLARIRVWLDENAPPVSALLNPPATLQAIAEAESKWGVTFPASVREAYLVHDGQSHPNRERVFRDWLWLPLDELESQFRWTRKHVDGDEIIPILESDGVSGCVRSVEKPGDESEFFSTGDGSDVVFADSFSLFLDQFAGELEAGKYVYWNGLFQLVEELEEIDDDEFE